MDPRLKRIHPIPWNGTAEPHGSPISAPPTIEYPCSDIQIRPTDWLRGFATPRVKHGNSDDIRALELAILRNIDLRRLHHLIGRVEEQAPPGTSRTIRQFFERAVEPCRVDELAADLGVTERTLQRRCRSKGLPAPHRLFSLARVFTVTRIVQWSAQPLRSVAFALGFSDNANCHRLLRRVLGSSLSRYMKPSEMESVEDVIVSEVLAYREAGAREN